MAVAPFVVIDVLNPNENLPITHNDDAIAFLASYISLLLQFIELPILEPERFGMQRCTHP